MSTLRVVSLQQSSNQEDFGGRQTIHNLPYTHGKCIPKDHACTFSPPTLINRAYAHRCPHAPDWVPLPMFGDCLCTCTVCTIVWLSKPVSSVLIHTCMWLLSNLQQALVHYVLCMYHCTHMGIYVYTFSHVGPQKVSHSESEATILVS